MINQEKQTLSIIEAAKILGIGKSKAYEAAKSGEIPSIRIGGRILVPKAALNTLLNSSVESGGTNESL